MSERKRLLRYAVLPLIVGGGIGWGLTALFGLWAIVPLMIGAAAFLVREFLWIRRIRKEMSQLATELSLEDAFYADDE